MILSLLSGDGKDCLQPALSLVWELLMAAKPKKATAVRQPERKWGPFHGGMGVAVWLNQTETADGTRYFRSITIAPRRYRDKKTGEWKDANSFRPADLSTLMLALQAAHEFIHSTPLPGQALDIDDGFDPELLEDEQPE